LLRGWKTQISESCELQSSISHKAAASKGLKIVKREEIFQFADGARQKTLLSSAFDVKGNDL
jgi:hypothetical protein